MYQIYIHTAPNGKRYVGQTCQRLERRWRNGHGYCRNPHFARAIEKYGWSNFEHEVVQLCETLEEANAVEKALIKEYRTNEVEYGYNISGGADGREKVAESTRQLMSKLRKGKFAGDKNPNFGRKHTAEERRKISDANRGLFLGEKSPLYGKHPSTETREKMRKAHKESEAFQEHMKKLNGSKAKRVLCVETGVVYPSARQAARETGFGQGNISAACRGEYEQSNGFHWEYI